MEYLFPNDEFVFAEWFTGEIRIGIGDMISYVHGGYASVYQGNMFLVFKDGVLIKEYVNYLTEEEVHKFIDKDENLPF